MATSTAKHTLKQDCRLSMRYFLYESSQRNFHINVRETVNLNVVLIGPVLATSSDIQIKIRIKSHLKKLAGTNSHSDLAI